MSPLREHALRNRLAAYLSREIALDQFKSWLVGATWEIDETGDDAAINPTYDIKLALAEQSSDRIDEDELHRQLRPLLALGPRPAEVAAIP